MIDSNDKQKLEQLRAPLTKEEIDWKVQRCGHSGDSPWAQVVPYADARAIQNRLDTIMGPENWKNHLTPTPGGMFCELSIKLGGEWVGKMDGSDETDYEPFKGSISKALIRAAVHWGIGRELYNYTTTYAKFVDKGYPGAQWCKIDGKNYHWIPDIASSQEPKPKGSHLQAVPSEPGAYVIRLGKKHVGKRLDQVDIYELDGFSKYLQKSEKRDALGNETLVAIETYLKTRETGNAK